MFSGSSLKWDKVGVAATSKYIGGFNQEFRLRGKLEEGIRLASYLHPKATYANVATEFGEAAIHLGARAETKVYQDMLNHAKDKEAVKDVIFDRATSCFDVN